MASGNSGNKRNLLLVLLRTSSMMLKIMDFRSGVFCRLVCKFDHKVSSDDVRDKIWID